MDENSIGNTDYIVNKSNSSSSSNAKHKKNNRKSSNNSKNTIIERSTIVSIDTLSEIKDVTTVTINNKARNTTNSSVDIRPDSDDEIDDFKKQRRDFKVLTPLSRASGASTAPSSTASTTADSMLITENYNHTSVTDAITADNSNSSSSNSSSSSKGKANNDTKRITSKQYNITIQDYEFNTSSISISINDTAVFHLSNETPIHAEHEIFGISSKNKLCFEGPMLNQVADKHFTYKPTEVGEIYVSCRIYSEMSMMINVRNVGDDSRTNKETVDVKVVDDPVTIESAPASAATADATIANISSFSADRVADAVSSYHSNYLSSSVYVTATTMSKNVQPMYHMQVMLDEFSIQPSKLNIICGTLVTFVCANNNPSHQISCDGEFDAYHLHEKKNVLQHVFWNEGSYQVRNEVFSFMVCIINVSCHSPSSKSPPALRKYDSSSAVSKSPLFECTHLLPSPPASLVSNGSVHNIATTVTAEIADIKARLFDADSGSDNFDSKIEIGTVTHSSSNTSFSDDGASPARVNTSVDAAVTGSKSSSKKQKKRARMSAKKAALSSAEASTLLTAAAISCSEEVDEAEASSANVEEGTAVVEEAIVDVKEAVDNVETASVTTTIGSGVCLSFGTIDVSDTISTPWDYRAVYAAPIAVACDTTACDIVDGDTTASETTVDEAVVPITTNSIEYATAAIDDDSGGCMITLVGDADAILSANETSGGSGSGSSRNKRRKKKATPSTRKKESSDTAATDCSALSCESYPGDCGIESVVLVRHDVTITANINSDMDDGIGDSCSIVVSTCSNSACSDTVCSNRSYLDEHIDSMESFFAARWSVLLSLLQTGSVDYNSAGLPVGLVLYPNTSDAASTSLDADASIDKNVGVRINKAGKRKFRRHKKNRNESLVNID